MSEAPKTRPYIPLLVKADVAELIENQIAFLGKEKEACEAVGHNVEALVYKRAINVLWHLRRKLEALDRVIKGPVASDGVGGGAGVELIGLERQRQLDAEGWTPEHDAKHSDGALALAATSYAAPPFTGFRSPGREANGFPPDTWPWADEWWKPTPDDRVRELTKAGALIAAEIDRLQAAQPVTYRAVGQLVATDVGSVVERGCSACGALVLAPVTGRHLCPACEAAL